MCLLLTKPPQSARVKVRAEPAVLHECSHSLYVHLSFHRLRSWVTTVSGFSRSGVTRMEPCTRDEETKAAWRCRPLFPSLPFRPAALTSLLQLLSYYGVLCLILPACHSLGGSKNFLFLWMKNIWTHLKKGQRNSIICQEGVGEGWWFK